MADDRDLRQDLLQRIDSRRAGVQAFLRENRPRVRRRATLTVVFTSLAAAFTAGPAFGGEDFSGAVQDVFGLADESTVWRVLCLLALMVSVTAAVLTNLNRSQDDAARLSRAEAAHTELEGLAGLLQYGQLSVEDGGKLYQEYIAKIPFVDDAHLERTPAGSNPSRQGGGYPPQQGGNYHPPQQGGGYPPQQGGGYHPPQQGGPYYSPPQQGGGYYGPRHGGGDRPPPGPPG